MHPADDERYFPVRPEPAKYCSDSHDRNRKQGMGWGTVPTVVSGADEATAVEPKSTPRTILILSD
jgi:hypothetical protein